MFAKLVLLGTRLGTLLACLQFATHAAGQVSVTIKTDATQTIDSETTYTHPLGRKVHFSLEEHGDIKFRDWIVIPKQPLEFDSYEPQGVATYASDLPRDLLVMVVVSDGVTRPATAYLNLEYGKKPKPRGMAAPQLDLGKDNGGADIPFKPDPYVPKAKTPPPPSPMKITDAAPDNDPARVFIRTATKKIKSDNKRNEAGAIAGLCLIRAGQLEEGWPSTNREIQTLAAAYKNSSVLSFEIWYAWFIDMRTLFNDLEATAGKAAPEKRAAWLRGVAEVLDEFASA